MLKIKLDYIDVKILEVLQQNAKISNIDLSQLVGLSPSPCLRRVRRLEKENYIKHYGAVVDQNLVGLPVNVFIQVSLSKQDEDSLKIFENENVKSNEVMEAYLMTGDSDYLLRVVTSDLEAFEKFLKKRLTRINSVSSIRSSFALKKVSQRSALPLNYRK